jgi:hypothetical protein
MALPQEEFQRRLAQIQGSGRRRASRRGLDNSQALYSLAVRSGLQKDADRILAAQKGEEVKQIFSGGFISDIFDTLNALQYGVVGMLKGKSFLEGVKTRQSFSDKDALGDKGIPGMIAGIGLDIAFDPLTYIAPATVVKKFPVLGKIGKAVKGAIFGKPVQKTIEGTKRTFQATEGGTKIGKWLGDKFKYMFGADPVYREMHERGIKNIAQGTMNLAAMTKDVARITPKVAQQILTRDKTGRFIRTPLNRLTGVLNPEEFQVVSNFYKKIDDLGAQAVDSGLLSKKKFEENFGEYIKTAFVEHETAKRKSIFGFKRPGIKGIKARKKVEDISEFGLTQIDNPAYLLFKSAFDLTKDVENAKLFRATAKAFGTDVAQEGFKQLPKTARFTTTTGAKVDILTGIKKVNQEIKPALKNLKKTFKADRETLSLIKSIEKSIGDLSVKRADELTKFFQEGSAVWKTREATQIIKGVGKLPDNLRKIGDDVKKFKTFDEMIKSDVGIKLEKLYQEGVLERAGFKDAIFKKGDKEIKTTGLKQFFNFVKKPFKALPEKEALRVQAGSIPKVIQLQKQIEKLAPKAAKLRSIDKRSIDDAYRYLEDTLNTLGGRKEALKEELGILKLGDLSGKYVPENIYNNLQEILDPVKDTIGKRLVANFKFSKVILNPATHARNIVSNQILNWWKLGMNPLDPRTISAQKAAITQMAKGGKWIDEAKTAGYGIDTFAANELKGMLDSPEALGIGKKIGSGWANIKNKLGNIYQGEENFAKLSAFIFNRKKGVGIEEAWKAAESATFNYAQVTPAVRRLRTALWGAPFITFALKAAPVAVETAFKAPRRISAFGKIKQAIESQADIKTTERERASEPPWVKDGFYIKLPMKDKHGRSAYFDLTYIIPFGDLVSGQFFERKIKRETGTRESIAEAALSMSPALNVIKELGRNQDFYGNRIWKESDTSEKQVGDIMRHLSKTYLPPLVSDQIPGGYTKSGERTQRGFVGAVTTPSDEENQRRTLMQEMLRQVGAKIQPIDADIQETYQEWNTQKALESLLRERGITKEFRKTYIPKR